MTGYHPFFCSFSFLVPFDAAIHFFLGCIECWSVLLLQKPPGPLNPIIRSFRNQGSLLQLGGNDPGPMQVAGSSARPQTYDLHLKLGGHSGDGSLTSPRYSRGGGGFLPLCSSGPGWVWYRKCHGVSAQVPSLAARLTYIGIPVSLHVSHGRKAYQQR